MTKSILTITLNPTVDKSTSVDYIKPEKKLRCEKPKYEPGGGGINVSRGLKRLGVDSIALFTSGGRSGKLLEELLSDENIKTLPIPVKAETRENFIVVETSHNGQYRFGMPGEDILPDEADEIFNKIANLSPKPDITVISGSLPAGIDASYIGKLIKLLKENNSLIVADTSGEALAEVLKQGVYLLKPNLGELSALTGKTELDNDTADEAAKQLVDEGKAEIVVVSLGPQGAYMVSKNECIHVPAPSVKKMSTVGAGDSMVAGMVSVLSKGGTLTEMARMGVACGSAATMAQGTGLFTKENAERLYNWLTK